MSFLEDYMSDNIEVQLQPKYLNAEQCAVRFAISVRHFKYLVSLGFLPKPVKFGRSSRWCIDTLEKFDVEHAPKLSGAASRRIR